MNLPAPRTAIGCHLRRPIRAPGAQRGAALLVALILLIVITLVGLAAIGTTILQNKMAANQYDRQIAFQSTEAAMRQATVWISSHVTATVPAPTNVENCATPLDANGVPVPPAANACFANPFADPGFAAGGGLIETVSPTDFNAGSLAAVQPQYAIQYMGCFQGPPSPLRDLGGGGSSPGPIYYYFYRITARSGNPTKVGNRSVVTLQSMFLNQPCSGPTI